MDLFVRPSLANGISNTILEFMFCGLSIIATNAARNRELVDDGVTRFLVPAPDSVAFANAMQRYFSDKTLLKTHGNAGRLKVETRFSMETMANSYMQLYDRVLERKVRQTVMQS